MTLYELTNELMQLMELAEDPDVDEVTFLDTLEGLGGEFEDKADGYAKVIRQLDADVAAIKTEIDRLSARKRSIENNIDRMKSVLKNAMILTDKRKFKTDLFSFSVAKNPEKVVMDAPDLATVPLEYLIQQEPKLDKARIKDDLKAGKDLGGIAHLEQDESLRIK